MRFRKPPTPAPSQSSPLVDLLRISHLCGGSATIRCTMFGGHVGWTVSAERNGATAILAEGRPAGTVLAQAVERAESAAAFARLQAQETPAE